MSSTYGSITVLTNHSAGNVSGANQKPAFSHVTLMTSQMPIYGHAHSRDPWGIKQAH